MPNATGAGPTVGIGPKELLAILATSALGGFALRGLGGLSRLVGRRLGETAAPVPPKIAVPEEEEEKAGAEKEAGLEDIPIIRHLPETLAAVGLGGAGMYGGWRLADYMFEQQRLKEIKQKIEKAKEEYEQALLGKAPGVRLRIPKTAAFEAAMRNAYEQGGMEGMRKESQAWEYGAAGLLSLLLLNAAYNAFKGARESSKPVQQLRAFKLRPKRRAPYARAVLAQPRMTPDEARQSATRLPDLTLEEDEEIEDPTKKVATVADVLIGNVA